MKIEQYGLTLERLKHDDIELLRQWRNHPKISGRMEYRQHITPQMQEAWFQSIQNIAECFYFIIKYNDKKIGLINSTYKYDYSEGGMFLWDDDYINSLIPIIASIALSDMHFYMRQKTEARIKIMHTNIHAIAYNTKLGFKLHPGQDGIENQLYILLKENYEKKSAKFKTYLANYFGGAQKIKITFDAEDKTNGVIDFFTGFSATRQPDSNLFEIVYP